MRLRRQITPVFNTDSPTMTLSTLPRQAGILLLTLWAGVCLALPAPHDIEQAVAHGQLPQAERMLREVIAEKPRSARAHYELAQVLAREGQTQEARQAIQAARDIDPSLKFAQSAEKFHAVAQAIEGPGHALGNTTTHTTITTATTASAPAAQPGWWWPALLSAGFALLVLALWRRMQARTPVQAAGMAGSPLEPMRGFGAQYDPRGPASTGMPAYPAPSSGSGMAGAVMGGLAGVAAGYALSKVLEQPDHTAQNHHISGTVTDPMDETGLVRMDAPARPEDLGSFDGGTGEDWEPAGDDDNW